MKINATPFKVPGGKGVDLAQWATRSKPLCKSKKAYRKALEDQVEALSEQQRLLYASNRHALLIVARQKGAQFGQDDLGDEGQIEGTGFV